MTQSHADRLDDILMLHARALERKKYVEAIERDDDFPPLHHRDQQSAAAVAGH